jgi:hypothetical protein
MPKATRSWQRRFVTGLCWFVAVQLLLFGPLKFSPVGFFGYPSYPEKFVALSSVVLFRHRRRGDLCGRDAGPPAPAFPRRGSHAVHPAWGHRDAHHQSRLADRQHRRGDHSRVRDRCARDLAQRLERTCGISWPKVRSSAAAGSQGQRWVDEEEHDLP